MSRDSKQGKDLKSQRTQGNPRRRRNRGEPNWYDRAVNADYQEEVMQIPKDKAGLIIGTKGWKKKEIMEESGVKALNIRDDEVHLKGTEEQCSKAKKIIDRILKGEDSWKKLDFIPKKYMGKVIGKNRERLKHITEKNTGVEFKTDPKSNQDGALYIRGPLESQKRAIRKIKEIVYNSEMKRKPKVQLVHVDTTQLDLDHDFELSSITPSDDGTSGETLFELKPMEPPSQDMEDSPHGFTGIENLKDKLLMVLENLHKEKEDQEEWDTVDIWCHLGHAYITNVDEDDQKVESFTLEEIKNKLEDEERDWRYIFKGVKKIEVEQIEKNLERRALKEEIRYDFTFYTPTCRYVRVKVFLAEKDGDKRDGDGATSMTFAQRAPFKVRSVMAQTLPDEQGDSLHTPSFYMCCQTQQRMKADILMLTKQCDYRLFVKTSPLISVVPRTPEAEEEDKILESYLMGMKIREGQVTLPPVSERPDGFDLFYQRRSRRRIYEYEMHFKDDNTENSSAGAGGKEQFSLLVSKFQEKTVDAAETDACGFDEIPTETDVHLHCEEWDQLLEEGTWEPEQIVAKLPTFFRFLRKIHSIVAPEVTDSDTDSSSSAD